MPVYEDDDGIRADNMPVGQLTHILGLISAGGDEVQTGLSLLEDFVVRVSTLAGFTPGMLDQLLARLALVEAATGTGTGLADQINALTAQLKAIRSTRYYGRPGEGPTSWTTDTISTAANANPLAIAAPYSVSTDGGGGIALRMTGEGAVTSIALIRLDDLQVLSLRYVLSRFVDSGTAGNNVPNLGLRCFKADGTYIGNATPLPVTDPLLKAAGVQAYTFQVALAAGVGTVNLPAGTRYVRPFVGNLGGTLDLYAVEQDGQSGNTLATSMSRNLVNWRPGEIISSWTAQPSVGDPLVALPLKVDRSYSIQNGVDGKVLRVASSSTVGVGPIYSHPLYLNDFLEYQPFLKRVVDTASTQLTMRLACFAADWTYIGAVTIGLFNPVVADGQVSPIFKTTGREILAQFPGTVRVRPYLTISSATGAVDISTIERRRIDVQVYESTFNHDNVTGMSLIAGSLNVYHLFFVHGQSLALGQNLNDLEALLATTPKFPGLALTMDAPSAPGSGPRLGTAAPTKIVDLIEVRGTNAGETIVSGTVNHALQRYDRETAPKLTLTVSNGVVVTATIDKETWGYSGAPVIAIDNTGTGGTGLSLTAVVTSVEDGGRLTSVIINNGGSGYTSAPKGTVPGPSAGTQLTVPKMFGFAAGKVGARYIQLRQGEARWQWVDAAIRAAKTEAAKLGGRVVCYAWAWKQGEADLIGGVPRQPEDIENWMVQYARQRASDTMAITGQTVVPVLIISPAATCHPDYDQWSQPYPRALELLRKRSGIRITGGTYQHPHSDASHLTNAGYNHAGQEVSRVYTHEISNDGWNDIHPTRSWRENATTLKVEFAVPPPESPLRPRLGLTLDLSDAIVKLDGIQGYGGFALRSRASGRALTITGITVDADGRTLTITHDTLAGTVAAASVVTASNAFTVSPRLGMETGTRVRLTSTGTLPSGVLAGVDYFVVRTLANQIKLSATLADALSAVPTAVAITSQGTGVHTLTADGRASGDSALQLVYATRRNSGNTNDDGPVLGARGCLRNNRAQANLYDGYLSHDWATPFDIVVSATAPFNRGLRFIDLESLKLANWIATDSVTGESLNVSAEVMRKYQEFTSMPETFPSKIKGQTAESKSKVVILPDDQRARFQIQCENADLAINIHGGKATFDADDPVLFAGGLYEFENKGYDAVSVIARKPVFRTDVAFSGSAKLAIDYDRKVPVGYISGNATGDQAISNYPDQDMSKLWRAILRDRINILSDLGIWDKQDVWMPPVHAKINLTVNLAKPDVPVTIVEGENKMLFVPYRWYGSGGAGAYLSTGLLPATGLRIGVDSHLMGCQVEAGAFETGLGVAGNSASLLLKPNAASGKASMRSGGNANDTFDVAATAWIAMNRNAADKYLAYVETVATEKSAVLTIAERVLTVCAVNNNSQFPATVSNQKLKCFHMGPQLQDQAKVLNLREAWKAIFAVGDAL